MFEELQIPDDDDFLDDENELVDIFCEESVVQEEEIGSTIHSNDEEDYEDHGMNFTCIARTAPKSTTMKSRTSRNMTVVEKNEETFYVCSCGFSSTNKSGSTRHKCRNPQDTVLFACKDCGKMCKNPGLLKRHLLSMHKNRQSMSLPLHAAPGLNSLSSSKDAEHKCQFCAKVLANKRNLSNHIAKVHGPGVMDTLSTSGTSSNKVDFDHGCTMCGKVLANRTNLKKHLEKVHGQTTPSDASCEIMDV